MVEMDYSIQDSKTKCENLISVFPTKISCKPSLILLIHVAQRGRNGIKQTQTVFKKEFVCTTLDFFLKARLKSWGEKLKKVSIKVLCGEYKK